jgi:Arc/MetJ-type ribon-helix-helix transcriptional regulator
MDIDLPADLEAFVTAQVQAGAYANPEAVVLEALQRLRLGEVAETFDAELEAGLIECRGPATALSTIAFHEAGHAVVAVALGRSFVRLSIEPVGAEPRGCRWSPGQPDLWVLIACSLAGAHSQVAHCPNSISPEKLKRFEKRILLPPEHWQSVYSCTGWFSGEQSGSLDFDPIWTLLLREGLPVPRFEPIRVDELIADIDETLWTFFRRKSVGKAVEMIAEALLRDQIIDGAAVDELVKTAKSHLESADYLEIIPPCLRSKVDIMSDPTAVSS